MSIYSRLKGSSPIVIYATAAELPISPVSAAGQKAYVTETNRLYVSNGSGWYSVALINTSPTITSGGDAAYELAIDGTPTVVTLDANDPEGLPITWNYAVTAGSLGSTATVSQSNNVFTITPSIVGANAGEFTLTFTASDGVNLATSASEFSLAFAGDWSLATQQAKILASDAEASDQFGKSVSISGDGNTVIAGAYYEDTGGADAGAAYIFTKSGSTWTQQAKLLASDAQASDYFGSAGAVSISNDGNTVIVGSYGEDMPGGDAAGAAYIFTRSGSTWTQQAKIQSSDKTVGDRFGYSTSISSDGNTVIVGADREATGGSEAGAAYIFTRSGSTWTEQAKIQASDKEAGDNFGYSTSISGDGNTVIVGAYYEATGGTGAGAAYIFTRSGSTWTQQAKIQASDIEAGDYFGVSVSISSDGNTVIVSAFLEDTGGSNAGSAYIFTRSGSTWTQQAKIQASDPEASDLFGHSVSISSDGNTAIVGSIYESNYAGSAYIFTRSGSTWTQQAKIQASDAEQSDYFGTSVSISGDGDTVIVGANNEDTGADNAGAAYIFVAG